MFDSFSSPKPTRKHRSADRRAGKVPHVGKQPRARNQDGCWRALHFSKKDGSSLLSHQRGTDASLERRPTAC